MNLKQHVPGHDTSVIDELDKEANVNEQTTTIKHSQMVESSVVQTEVSQNDKSWSNKKKWLHLRSDVVNKTLLRAVKRFYSNKFKMLQKSIAKRSSHNATTVDILDTLTQFWEQQFEGLKLRVEFRLLAQFMMLFLDIKTKSAHRLEKSISNKAKKTLDCLRKYSADKFKDVQKWRELRILIVKIYEHNLEEFFSEAKTIQMSRDRYIEAIEDIIDIYS